MIRRKVLFDAEKNGTALSTSANCASAAGEAAAARALRRALASGYADRASRMQEALRSATFAPSSHNTRCWKSCLLDDSMTMAPDLPHR